MHLNYLILAHKNLLQLDRLVKTLANDHTRFFIHIDKRTSWEELQKFDFFHDEKVHVSKDRFPVTWGGFNMVQATLALMKIASAKSNNGYFILISGQDFPIKSNEYIYDLLRKNYGTEYITHWPIPYEKWSSGGLNRLKYYWFVDKIGFTPSRMLYWLQKICRIERRYIQDTRPFGGAQWWCLTSDCIKYILEFVGSNPAFLQFFKHTLIADEMFFQTIVLNSSFSVHAVNNHLRYIKFDGLNNHPDMLALKDLPHLTASGDLWARKFAVSYDSNILEALERHIKR